MVPHLELRVQQPVRRGLDVPHAHVRVPGPVGAWRQGLRRRVFGNHGVHGNHLPEDADGLRRQPLLCWVLRSLPVQRPLRLPGVGQL